MHAIRLNVIHYALSRINLKAEKRSDRDDCNGRLCKAKAAKREEEEEEEVLSLRLLPSTLGGGVGGGEGWGIESISNGLSSPLLWHVASSQISTWKRCRSSAASPETGNTESGPGPHGFGGWTDWRLRVSVDRIRFFAETFTASINQWSRPDLFVLASRPREGVTVPHIMRNPLGKAPVKGDDGIVGYGEGSGGRLAPPLGHRQSKAREVLVIRSRISGGLYLEHKDEEDAVRDDNDNSERRGGSGCH
ncbi:hypothetical protein GW17_00042912 [Ensete ventricosum]|nr:hypothetical protein GW17_00042912 [Ensete ventricosum]